MHTETLILNLFAQDKISFKLMVNWFDSLSESRRAEVLLGCYLPCHQSHPTLDDLDIAINASKLKRTYTPCVLVIKKPFVDSLDCIVDLPSDEHRKAFILLSSIFKVADSRRRKEECRGNCYHDWHNISSKVETEMIRVVNAV